MENYKLTRSFTMGGLMISPAHVRIERHPPVIAAHRHANTSYEIHYAQSGHGTVVVNGATHPVGPDTLYVTGRGVEHAQRSDPEDPIVEYCLYLNCRRAGSGAAGPLSPFAETAFWIGADGGRVFPLLERLIVENRQPQPDSPELVETLLRLIIVQLARICRQHAVPAPEKKPAPVLSRAETVFVIEDAFLYSYRTLTLQELAGLLNLSVRQTQRVLRDNFGKTFSQKLTESRMAAACQFLSGDDLSVTEISERLGFSSIEHFSAAFRRAMGRSPRAYRKGQK